MKMWDRSLGKYVTTPLEVKNFLDELEDLFEKYNLYIRHEDSNGSFILGNYDGEGMGRFEDSVLELSKEK